MPLLTSARVISDVKCAEFPLAKGSMFFSCYLDEILLCIFKKCLSSWLSRKSAQIFGLNNNFIRIKTA